jgi:hypothetical protein
MLLQSHFSVLLIWSFVAITIVSISLGGDSFYLHCLVYGSMVGLRARFGAPLTPSPLPLVFIYFIYPLPSLGLLSPSPVPFGFMGLFFNHLFVFF